MTNTAKWNTSGSNRCPTCGKLRRVRKELKYRNGQCYSELVITCDCS